MEKYRKQLQFQNRSLLILCVLTFVITIVVGAISLNKTGNDHFNDFSMGLQTGLIASTFIVAVKTILKNWRLLKNKQLLEEEWVKVSDERNQYINRRTYATTLAILIGTIAIATIISGFFDFIVFYTLGITIIFAVIVLIVVNAIYKRKY